MNLNELYTRWTSVLLLGLLIGGCDPSTTDFGDGGADASSTYAPGQPLEVYVSGTMGCSTTVVFGLAQQLVDALSCENPGSFAVLPDHPRIRRGDAFFPSIQTAVVNALINVADAGPNTIALTSGLRTLPQQYLLYQWGERNVCGVGVVAAPNRSNHLSGSAVDVSNWAAMRPALEERGFVWFGSTDAVHFDLPVGTTDTREDSVRVFQRLWNLNHPEDAIAEDGVYGQQTVARLLQSPVNGFARPLPCGG